MASRPAREDVEAWLHGELTTAPETTLSEGYQGTVTLIESPFGPLVVKRPHTHWVWRHFAQASIEREYRAYSRLYGIGGVPACYGLIDGKFLVLEYVPGETLRQRQQPLSDNDSFFASMYETIEAMHSAGVAHCDLKRKNNILVGPDETPWLIDFGAAWILKPDAGRMNRVFFEYFAQTDRHAWLKRKYGTLAADMSAEDAALHQPLLLERIARVLRILWQKLSLRRPRQRWRARRAARRDRAG